MDNCKNCGADLEPTDCPVIGPCAECTPASAIPDGYHLVRRKKVNLETNIDIRVSWAQKATYTRIGGTKAFRAWLDSHKIEADNEASTAS